MRAAVRWRRLDAPTVKWPCWPPQVVELPPAVLKEAQEVEPLGTMLYPYWLVEVHVSVKGPLLPRANKRMKAAVDGVTGLPSVIGADMPVVERNPQGGGGNLSERVLCATPFALPEEDLDRGRLRQALLPYVSRRLRSWMNVSVEIGEARPVYKELRLFAVRFLNRSEVVLALDTVTGEYGVAPSGVAATSFGRAVDACGQVEGT